MGLRSKIVNKIRTVASEKREQYQKKRNIDQMAKKVEQKEYMDQYYEQKMQRAKQNAKERAQNKATPAHIRTGRSSGRTYNAAKSGIGFLSGDMFGGGSNSSQVSANINNLLGFGPKRKAPVSNRPKQKVTTIRSGGKTITIREAPDAEQEKKRERTVADNINDLLGF